MELILDIETQKEFSEVGGRGNFHLLGVSLVGVFSYEKGAFLSFQENEIKELEKLIASAKRVVGFNIKGFDWPVLQPYLAVDLKKIPTLDIMEEIKNEVGHRVSLNSVAAATVGEKKSGDGLEAIRFFREGNIEALRKYCLDDVRLTRDVYEFGKNNKKVFFESRTGGEKIAVPVDWELKKESAPVQAPQLNLF